MLSRCSCARASLLAALLLSLHAALTNADVYVLAPYGLEPLPDLEADFGPAVPANGIEGVLKLATPLDACQPFTFSDFDTQWIALISRQQQLHNMNCTFDIKVMHAQMAGAVAAIVYDDFYESLIIMSMPKGHTEPSIPSAFVTERSGFILNKLLEVEPGMLRVRIMPVTTVAWLEALVSTLLGLMSITMVVASFYAMRSWGLWLTGNHRMTGPGINGAPGQSAPRNAGLPANLIRNLPVIIYEAASSRTASRCGSLRCGKDKAWTQSEPMDMGPSEECAASVAMEEGEAPALMPTPGSSSNSSEHDWPQPTGLHAGETKRVCTICLEDYTEGEKVRVLPCLHRFHKQCVDQWLSSRRMCPVCKHDAGLQLAPDAGGGGGDGTGRSRSGLGSRLARLGSGLRSWFGLAPPPQPLAPAAQPLLPPSPPLSPAPEPAPRPRGRGRGRGRASSSMLQQSRLWDLYVAYSALDSGPGGSAAAAGEEEEGVGARLGRLSWEPAQQPEASGSTAVGSPGQQRTRYMHMHGAAPAPAPAPAHDRPAEAATEAGAADRAAAQG